MDLTTCNSIRRSTQRPNFDLEVASVMVGAKPSTFTARCRTSKRGDVDRRDMILESNKNKRRLAGSSSR